MTANSSPFRSPRDYVLRNAEADRNRTAVISGQERLSYGQLAERTERLADALRRAGVGPGVQVALMLPNSVGFIVWFYAVWRTGAVVMPAAPTMTPDEADDVIRRPGIPFVAASVESVGAGTLPGASAPVYVDDDGVGLWNIAPDAPALETVPWTASGYLIRQSSSGSTGRPKHLFRTEENVVFDLLNLDASLGLAADDVMLGVHPIHTVPGIKVFISAFYLGACVTILPRFMPGAILETARRDRVSVFRASPAMIEALASCMLRDGDESAFRSLKLLISSGAPLRTEVRRSFVARFGVPVRDQYGSTETMNVAIDLADPPEEGRMGPPLPGIEVAIFDQHDRPLPTGNVGLVGIRSPAASTSYIDNPEATARVFRNGWVFPGDRGYLDQNGCLHVVGRDDVINVGGNKVDPLEVEHVIRRALPVREVIVVPGTRAGLPAVRVIVEADPAHVTSAMVVDACRSRLSAYKVPAQVEVRAHIERTASGKIVRSSLGLP